MSLESVTDRAVRALSESGREPDELTILAVSKGHSTEEIRVLYEAGHRDFGENRAQELRDKVPELPDDIRWHFVGPLQSNKARIVRPAVVALHSMDRRSLASAWMKGSGRPPACYLQVNIGREPQKSGVMPEEVPSMVSGLGSMGVPIIGLMTIPPLVDDPEESRPHFAALRVLRDEISADHPAISGLSMGMTNDFEIAIQEGATVIRVGRAIFQD